MRSNILATYDEFALQHVPTGQYVGTQDELVPSPQDAMVFHSREQVDAARDRLIEAPRFAVARLPTSRNLLVEVQP